MPRLPPADSPAKRRRRAEIIVLHDPEEEKSVVIAFFDNEEDYQHGTRCQARCRPTDSPGQRTGVAK